MRVRAKVRAKVRRWVLPAKRSRRGSSHLALSVRRIRQTVPSNRENLRQQSPTPTLTKQSSSKRSDPPMTTPVTLLTPRLRLRFLGEDECPRFAELANCREVYATTGRLPFPYTIEHAHEYRAKQLEAAETGQAVRLAVTDRETEAVIGAVGLEIEAAVNRAELGFWIGVPYWGKGYATEAAAAIIGYGFDVLGLHRIFARHLAGNEASGRVQRKIGMTREGLLRAHAMKDGVYHDDVIHGILKSDPRPICNWSVQ